MKTQRIADDVTELATRISVHLPQYLPALRDAQRGQPGAQQYGMVHSSGHIGDPTFEAAEARYERKDQAAIDEAELRRHLNIALVALHRAHKILEAYNARLVVNDRAGIGRCTCGRYCDGKDVRLTNYKGTGDLVCPACRASRDRAAVA